MGLINIYLNNNKTNFLEECGKDKFQLHCIECGQIHNILYIVNDLYMCKTCTEAFLIRDRFLKEDSEWANK